MWIFSCREFCMWTALKCWKLYFSLSMSWFVFLYIFYLYRRSVLLSNLSSVDTLFSAGRKECKRIEERLKELRTAIQKARHVVQVPSLGTYCNLDEVMLYWTSCMPQCESQWRELFFFFTEDLYIVGCVCTKF